MKQKLSKTILSLGIGLGLVIGGSLPAMAGGNHHKVTICHAVQGQGQHGNGFNSNTVDVNSTQFEGHDSHSGDVIPAFGTYPGKNLSTVYGWGFTGQELLNNGCKTPKKPELPIKDFTVVGEWSEYLVDCTAGIATKTRTVTTGKKQKDEQGNWNVIPESVVETTETKTRTVTTEECPPAYIPPTYEPVVLTNHTCDAVGSFVVPEHDQSVVVYRFLFASENGVAVALPGGTYPATVGVGLSMNSGNPNFGEPIYDTLTVNVHDAKTWPNDPMESWTITLTEPEDCDAPEEPEEPETPVLGDKTPTLPDTGVEDLWLLGLAATLITLGGGATFLGRRFSAN